jgi:hypothetical protein
MMNLSFQLTPFFIDVDGVTVQIVEASKTLLGEYIVSVRIIYKGIYSRVFPLAVKNTDDLMNKLKVEISKVKFIEYTFGIEEVKKLIV